jgi:Neuraminidase-like domain
MRNDSEEALGDSEATAHTYLVTGSVQSPALPGVADVTVQLVDKNVGGDQVLASTRSSVGGAFSFSVVVSPAYLAKHSKSQPDLQVQVLTEENVLASSEVRYSAPRALSLNVVVPATAAGLPSEYETLTASLATVYSGSLGELQEGGTRQDVTYLANKTGWDARAVALAALAEQFSRIAVPSPAGTAAPASAASAKSVSGKSVSAKKGAAKKGAVAGKDAATSKIPAAGKDPANGNGAPATVRPEFYYALFRAGLPANADVLFQVSPTTVQAVWQQAITQGVIPQTLSEQVAPATETFQALSAARALTAKPAVGVSTLAEMLQKTLPKAGQQEQFAQLYTQYADDPDTLWPAVEKALGVGPAAQLQSLGKLYYLTLNNQPLVEALLKATSENGAAPLSSPVELATRGYYEPSAWEPLIAAGSVPPQVPGSDASEQASNYGDLLAAQVRLAYPTAVLADQVRRGIMPLTDTDEVASAVVDFLNAQQGEFEIGVEPVEAFIARTGVTGTSDTVIAQVKRLQRAYQLTPDDASLAVLLNHNLDSAYAITRYDPAGFVRTFAEQLGGEDTAGAIHARARQVFVSVLSVATEYLKGRVTPTLGGAVPVQFGFPPPAGTPPPSVVAYPTLEGLFGSLDYCSCSECSSILSPAAYFVDLLHFIDQPAPSAGLENPQDVLFERRPDLQYLNLTCANTDTELPSIDVVNETLEYYVANGLSIEGYQGQNTSEDITSAELIASPQYVNDDAYTVLQGAFFPPPLPFNRPLTLLRLQLQSMGVELPAAMAALRANENLTNTATPTGYGWQDILIEQLGISREEYRLFTDPSLDLGDLYGLAPQLSVAQQVQTLQNMSLQDFSRRLGVSYDDFVAIVQTQFINPNAAIIPLLEQLNCTFATLEQLNSDPQSNSASFINALPAGLDATRYGATTPTDYSAVVTWITNNYARIIDIITITNTTGNADDCSGADLCLRYTNPASPLLSGTDFLKLIRFIRLWQKLAPLLAEDDDSAAIEYTDNILAALYPSTEEPLSTDSDATNQSRLDTGFKTLLLRLGLLVQVMDKLSLNTDSALDQLLACWAPIGTLGASSLYATMFLTPALLQQDPGAQTAMVSSTVSAGDVLSTTINPADGAGAEVTYTVTSGQSAATVATAIAALINNSTAIDPATEAVGLPVSLSQRYFASADGGVLTIKAGFTLACETSAGATETYEPLVAPAGSPVRQVASVTGTVTAGDTLTTKLDTVAVVYTVLATDTLDTVASAIAAAINATTTADPYSGLPLNELVVATSSGPSVILQAANAGAPFTLACSLTPPGAGSADASSYSVAEPTPESAVATVAGAVPAGATLTTILNGLPVLYLVKSGYTPLSIAQGIAQKINDVTTADPITSTPLNEVLHALASPGPHGEGQVTVTAIKATTPFTIEVAMTASGYTAGRQTPPFAQNGSGEFLTDPAQTLFGHEPTLCAACNITGAEFQSIVGALGYDASTPLSLDTVSALFRRGWLAHTLGLSVVEFLLLVKSAGLDPFAPLDPGVPPAALAPPVIGFIGLLGAMSAAGLDIDQALYLMWNQDISSTSAPSSSEITGLAVALRAAFATVDAAFTLQEDPSGSIAQGLMTLVYGTGATDFFFGLLNSTFTTSVAYAAPPGVSSLPQAVLAASGGRLSYDDLAKQLTFAGVLDGATQATIDAAITVATTAAGTTSPGLATFTPASMTNIYPGTALVIDTGAAQETVVATTTTATTFTAQTIHAHNGTLTPFAITSDPTFAQAIANLAAANLQAVAPFFATYPELEPLYLAYAASADPPQTKRTALLANFLPILIGERKREQALASVTSIAGADQSFAAALLQDASVLHADADPSAAAVSDFTGIEQQGLSARFFLTNDLEAQPDQQAAYVPALSYAQTATIGGTIIPGEILTTTIAGIAVPYTVGAFTLASLVSEGATETLTVAAKSPVSQSATVSGAVTAGDTLTVTLDGVPVPYTVLAGDTAASIAANIAAAINATSVEDPLVGAPLNQVLTAASAGAVVTVTVVPGDASTTPSLLASGIAAAINATTTPVGGVPLNQVVLASASDSTIALAAANLGSGGYSSLACSVSGGASTTYTAGTQLPAVGGAKLAAVWSGYITVPQSGAYDINIAADPGATITLELDGVQVLGPPAGGLWSNDTEISLVAGALVPIVLRAQSLSSTLAVSWRSQGLGWQAIPSQYLYSLDLVNRLSDTYVRFLKAAALAEALSLTAAEIARFGTGKNLALATAVGWINSLAGDPAESESASASASLAGVLMALLDFARIKQALSPNDSRLLAVLEDPTATLASGQSALLSLTGWSQESLAALLTQFFPGGAIANLTSIESFRRVYDAFTVVTTSRLSASALISAITNAPSPSTISTLQSALRSQYAPADWLTAVTPISNAARILQRNALVAYIVQREGDLYEALQKPFTTTVPASTGSSLLTVSSPAGAADALLSVGMTVQGTEIAPGTTVAAVAGDTVTINSGILASLPVGSTVTFAPPGPAISTSDDLYAYLMIDPENQPPVLTSRVLLGILTVQLFIERAIRNLEPQVAPTDINDSQWTWMKRYRVWQANREVFLWPENVLYEELRDNQSPFFQTAMSTLLQGDITDEAATSAYLDYLTNLEEVAKLEACGLYYEPATTDTDESALVVSRTAGAHRKYYFRELSSGSWEPWAEAQIDCEDLPLTPIVWNGRLFLFWLRILKQAQQSPPATAGLRQGPVSEFELSNLAALTEANQTQNQVAISAVLCWSEYYNGKWQPTKTSDVNLPTSLSDPQWGLGTFDASGPGSFEQSTRGLLRLVPAQFTGTSLLAQLGDFQFTPPEDALILTIVLEGANSPLSNIYIQPFICGGFMLHNTHSLPVRLDDFYVPSDLFGLEGVGVFWRGLDLPSPARSLSAVQTQQFAPTPLPFSGTFASGTFTIAYQHAFGQSAVWTNPVLDFTWIPRFTEPQPGLEDAWEAPFIYEDRRNIFYVKTTIRTRAFIDHTGFGLASLGQASGGAGPQIPPLVLRNGVAAPPGPLSSGLPQSSPSAIRRYIAQGTDLNAALSLPTTITYQGRVIVPTGSVPTPAPAAEDNGKGA